VVRAHGRCDDVLEVEAEVKVNWTCITHEPDAAKRIPYRTSHDHEKYGSKGIVLRYSYQALDVDTASLKST
jgi:hypothetical protein